MGLNILKTGVLVSTLSPAIFLYILSEFDFSHRNQLFLVILVEHAEDKVFPRRFHVHSLPASQSPSHLYMLPQGVKIS